MNQFPINIRPLETKDIPAVAQIARLSSPYPWSAKVFYDCLKANYSAWVLCQNMKIAEGEIIGFVVILCQIDECQLLNIGIRPDLQRKGFGKKLLKHIIDYAKTQRLSRVTLEVRCSNKAAIALYESLGFMKIGVRKQYYPIAGGREDALIFALHG